MTFRRRLIIAFSIVLVLPVILFILSFIVIGNFLAHGDNGDGAVSYQDYVSLTDDYKEYSELLDSTYEKIQADLEEDPSLVEAIAEQPSDVSKQICLYAMMRQYRLVQDFMLTVIGEKYRKLDSSFGKIDLNVFFQRLQEQDDWVATWSDSTITKLKQVLQKLLVDNEYLDSADATRLNPVLISPLLENAIRADGQEYLLPAFNCLS